jgi:hypothetical protein
MHTWTLAVDASAWWRSAWTVFIPILRECRATDVTAVSEVAHDRDAFARRLVGQNAKRGCG